MLHLQVVPASSFTAQEENAWLSQRSSPGGFYSDEPTSHPPRSHTNSTGCHGLPDRHSSRKGRAARLSHLRARESSPSEGRFHPTHECVGFHPRGVRAGAYNSRAGLEDRVWRIESGTTIASVPMPRTCHLVTNVRITDVVDNQPHVSAHWQVHMYRAQQHHSSTYFGLYEYVLRPEQDAFKIAKKKIILLNDEIETVLDIYHV